MLRHPRAVNTPFYRHPGSVVDNAPPPPPVYQPEILGEAIYLAGTRQRNVSVGLQTPRFNGKGKL
jgi:hypothetical protein